MCGDITNLWKEDTDANVVKTWLLGVNDGQTYPILERFLPRIKIDEDKYIYDFCDIEGDIDEAIGWKHDYKLDDAELDKAAEKIVDELTALVAKINANPKNYFSCRNSVENGKDHARICENCAHRFACEENKPDFNRNGCCVAFNFPIDNSSHK